MKFKIQAQHLQAGDIVGSGETIQSVSAGIKTPKGKVDIWLASKDSDRHAQWGKYTLINVERPEADFSNSKLDSLGGFDG